MSRPLGSPTLITKVRDCFFTVFEQLGGSQGLYDWANKNDQNKKAFYTMCVKLSPKEIKTENMNRTHEQFIEAIMQENKRLELSRGKPSALIEITTGNQGKTQAVT